MRRILSPELAPAGCGLRTDADLCDDRRYGRLALAAVGAECRGCGRQRVNNLHALRHTGEDHVTRWQIVGRMHDEELAAVRVRACVGHRDNAAPVTVTIDAGLRIDLVFERPAPRALAAGPVTTRVATLDHEPLDDAVKREAIVIAVLGEQAEVFDGFRRLAGQELDVD